MATEKKKNEGKSQIVISFEDVDPIEVLGVHNTRLALIQNAFPNIKIVSRGNKIKISGSKEEVRKLRSRIEKILDHIRRYGYITDNVMRGLLSRSEGIEEIINPYGEDVLVVGPGGHVVKPRTENQRRIVEAVEDNDIVFAIGPAGTGKTYTAVALAVRALQNKQVKRIILTRPAVEAGESLGYLPGTLEEKVEPYLRPLYDALFDMLPAEKVNVYIEQRVIEIAPLAYMRGRTLDKAFIILDEAQNATLPQLKMFLTRLGPEAKTIITGDLTQVDLPQKHTSGLATTIRILKDIEGIDVVYLDRSDVIRHPLVGKIIRAFESLEEQEKNVENAQKHEKDKKRDEKGEPN
ncbi:MAG: PhoH family protein [Chlorobi bacterium]|nr:PhoH family protein [Chlorobiota bacterium]